MIRAGRNFYMDRGTNDSFEMSDDVLTIGDVLTLTVKTMSLRPKVLLEMETSVNAESGMKFDFVPDDTKDITEGKYIYTVMVKHVDGTVHALIKNRLFVIM